MISPRNLYRAWGWTAGISFATMIASPFLASQNLETVVEQSPTVSEKSSNPVSYGWLALFGASAVLSVSATLKAAHHGFKHERIQKAKQKQKNYELHKDYLHRANPSQNHILHYFPRPSKILI
jgi:hypothetical protein